MNRQNTAKHDIPAMQADLPTHVAVIMDGNGRWARRRALPRVAGHRKGAEALRGIIRACLERGIGYLTVFAFSSENWRRPPEEVERLMALFVESLDKEIPVLNDNGVCFRVIGERASLRADISERMHAAELLTANNTRLHFTVALNYGGHWDIAQAAQSLSSEVASGVRTSTSIDADAISERISTASLPAPDLFIRTGGEHRLSNFLLWQLAYTELFFTDTLWPDFDGKAFDDALADFARRQRRFGKTGEQVEAS